MFKEAHSYNEVKSTLMEGWVLLALLFLTTIRFRMMLNAITLINYLKKLELNLAGYFKVLILIKKGNFQFEKYLFVMLICILYF